MKKICFLAVAFVAALSFSGTEAHAAATPIGYINADDSGEFTNNEVTATGTVYDWAEGTLAGKTSILFTYMINPSTSHLSFFGGQPSSTLGNYEVPLIPSAFNDGAPELELGSFALPGVFKTVITQTSDFFFTVLISNLSLGDLDFSTYLKITDAAKLQNVGASWSSAAVVPLPAALPLFGLGLAGLAGYRRLKKSNKAV